MMFLALAMPGPTMGAASGAEMWGCAPVGQRLNILYLTDQGARSYVKFSGQRIAARLTVDGAEKRWTWGSNAMALGADDLVRYYEGDTLKAEFKCKKLQ